MASAFADCLETAEADLRQLQQKVSAISSAPPDGVKKANDEASLLIKNVEKYVKDMEREARSCPPSQKREMQESIERLKADLSKSRLGLQRANDAANRRVVMSRSAKPDDERDRLVTTTEKAFRTTDKLQAAHTVLNETEDIGINVVETMKQQRTIIERAHGNAVGTNALTEDAKGRVIQMQRIAFGNKFILAAIILVLLGAIGVVVYFGYFKSPP